MNHLRGLYRKAHRQTLPSDKHHYFITFCVTIPLIEQNINRCGFGGILHKVCNDLEAPSYRSEYQLDLLQKQ